MKNNTDKKLLLVNYYWPPSGGPAVQRWLSLTKELAKLGWQIWVLTVDERYATYQLYDKSLEAKIHPSITVVKTKTIEPFGIFKLLFGKKSIPAPGFSNEANPSTIKKITRFIRGNLFVPDPRKYWKQYAVKAGNRLVKEHEIKLVITAGPPHSTHFIGQQIKQQTGIHWICDFHDLWTDVIYYDLLLHLPPIKRYDLTLERKILESCDHVFTVGEKYKQKLMSKSPLVSNKKISVIRIGYDAALFEEEAQKTATFTIAYVGSIAPYYQPEVFFKAIQPTAKKDNRVNIEFTGVASPAIKELIDKYGLQSNFTAKGYVDHDTAVEIMKSATVLLLINPVTKDESMVIPGKIYEYLATQNPIINITTHDSETALLIEECKAGKTFERNEAAALQAYIEELYDQWVGSLTAGTGDTEQIKQFSHAIIARQVEQICLRHNKSASI